MKYKKVKVDTCYGIPMWVYSNDRIGKALIDGGWYEGEQIDIMLMNSDADGLAIDVGANIGTHTIRFAQHFGSVAAFEPQQLMVDILTENVKENNLDNVTIYPMALGHKGMMTHIKNDILDEDDVNYGSRNIANAGDNRVEMRTLDSFGFENVKLIKIDVEGAEPLVFWGARETIKKWRPVIFFEWDKTDEFLEKRHIFRREIKEFKPLKFLEELKYFHVEHFSKNVLIVP